MIKYRLLTPYVNECSQSCPQIDQAAAIMRLLHYPPQTGPVDDRVLGIGAHTELVLRSSPVPIRQVILRAAISQLGVLHNTVARKQYIGTSSFKHGRKMGQCYSNSWHFRS
jgi:hypothetical protein